MNGYQPNKGPKEPPDPQTSGSILSEELTGRIIDETDPTYRIMREIRWTEERLMRELRWIEAELEQVLRKTKGE